MNWLDIVAPVLVFLGVAGGWFTGRRRQKVEVENLSVSASKIAVETLIATIEPLKFEIASLKAEVGELKVLNAQLLEENNNLASSVKQLRRLVAQVDDYPPYFAERLKEVNDEREAPGRS